MRIFFKRFGPYRNRWFDISAVVDNRQITAGLAYGETFVEIHLPFLTCIIEW